MERATSLVAIATSVATSLFDIPRRIPSHAMSLATSLAAFAMSVATSLFAACVCKPSLGTSLATSLVADRSQKPLFRKSLATSPFAANGS